MAEHTECKAKDPSTCRYHGALNRMEKAEKLNDLDGYLTARKDLLEAKKDSQKGLKKFFQKEDQPVPDEVQPSVFLRKAEQKRQAERKAQQEAEIRKEKRDSDRMFRERTEYLADSEAVPTPMEAYALWLTVYEKQSLSGGTVESSESDYNSLGRVFGNRNVAAHQTSFTEDQKFDYEDITWDRWTPTNNSADIPAGYGSASLELFILTDVTGKPFPATSDRRKGWEWGHTTVYMLSRDKETGNLVAETNSRNVRSFKDVERYRKGKSVQQLTEALTLKIDGRKGLQ